MADSVGWFAVRTVFTFGKKPDGKNIFEERIVCFRAEEVDQALDKAAEEAATYADENDLIEIHDESVAYVQDGDALIDGYELWSMLYESELSLDEFYERRYSRFTYTPD